MYFTHKHLKPHTKKRSFRIFVIVATYNLPTLLCLCSCSVCVCVCVCVCEMTDPLLDAAVLLSPVCQSLLLLGVLVLPLPRFLLLPPLLFFLRHRLCETVSGNGKNKQTKKKNSPYLSRLVSLTSEPNTDGRICRLITHLAKTEEYHYIWSCVPVHLANLRPVLSSLVSRDSWG